MKNFLLVLLLSLTGFAQSTIPNLNCIAVTDKGLEETVPCVTFGTTSNAATLFRAPTKDEQQYMDDQKQVNSLLTELSDNKLGEMKVSELVTLLDIIHYKTVTNDLGLKLFIKELTQILSDIDLRKAKYPGFSYDGVTSLSINGSQQIRGDIKLSILGVGQSVQVSSDPTNKTINIYVPDKEK